MDGAAGAHWRCRRLLGQLVAPSKLKKKEQSSTTKSDVRGVCRCFGGQAPESLDTVACTLIGRFHIPTRPRPNRPAGKASHERPQ
jgi:hypothetical protein